MSDLIDRQELLKHKGNCYDEEGHLLYAVGTGTILLMPTVDAEHVVRCIDCIYYGDLGDMEMECAMMILYPNKPTDYCSLGVRREDAELH